ncbi:hypothetical protein HELRODRAFT_189144 [Helobdella robusta]|uniref:Uncharacterized protein n=1 Tax=Helobdella robusta TaxID=6412 RepID=T1FQQ1_HELRO|nr:hypothetical protein HELRODRAFT_189144 [Helobdella robusta]ESN96184.1 hypothetical protein HELRODRAFT_189144 [Helobdella robusta]
MDSSKLDLKDDIIEILKDADLTKLSTKKIRIQLEEKYKVDLMERKSEIDFLVMAEIENIEKCKSTKNTNSKAKPQHNGPAPKKMKRDKVEEEEDDDNDDDVDDKSEDEEDDKDKDKNTEDDEDIARQLQEEEENGAIRKTRHAHKKKTPAKSEKKEKKQRKKGAPRENRFTETCNLSPELAAIMGEDKLKRSDVVKRMWAIVKERNLFDPKNKQWMICDDQMYSVFGKKKVKLFGMMKYLTSHIYKSDEVISSPLSS